MHQQQIVLQPQTAMMAGGQAVFGGGQILQQTATGQYIIAGQQAMPGTAAVYQTANGQQIMVANNPQQQVQQQRLIAANYSQQMNQLVQVVTANGQVMTTTMANLQAMGAQPTAAQYPTAQYANINGQTMLINQQPAMQYVTNEQNQMFAIGPSMNYAQPQMMVNPMNAGVQQYIQIQTPQGIQLIPASSLMQQSAQQQQQQLVQQSMVQAATAAHQQQAVQQHHQRQSQPLPEASEATRLHVQQIIEQQQQQILQQQLQQQQLQQQALAKVEAAHASHQSHQQQSAVANPVTHLLVSPIARPIQPAIAQKVLIAPNPSPVVIKNPVVTKQETSTSTSTTSSSKSPISSESMALAVVVQPSPGHVSPNQQTSVTSTTARDNDSESPPVITLSQEEGESSQEAPSVEVESSQSSDGDMENALTISSVELNEEGVLLISVDPSPRPSASHVSSPGSAKQEPESTTHSCANFMTLAKNSVYETLHTTDVRDVEGVNLLEIQAFAKHFKLRRLSLGLTQTQVGQALSATEGPSYSQSAICRFEKMDITPKSAQKIKPVLEKWMVDAEERFANGTTTFTDIVGSDSNKKRKRRTSFKPDALDLLSAFFEHNTHPTGPEMTELSERLNYDREVVRVWFCNKRQALRNACKKIRADGTVDMSQDLSE